MSVGLAVAVLALVLIAVEVLNIYLGPKRGDRAGMKKGHADEPQPIDCHLLDVQALRVGDVLLTSSPGQPVSELIRAVTHADYSHAILVISLDPPYAIESSDYGVVKFRLDRFAVREPLNIAVRRVRPSLIAKAHVQDVVRFAERMVTREYADREVLAALFERMPRLEQGKFFCSQLIAEAYGSAGVTLVPQRRPERTTPGMLADSDVFDKVTGFLRFCRASDLPLLPAFLDGPNPQSPAEKEAEARQRAFRMVEPVFARHEHHVTDYFDALHELADVWRSGQTYTAELDQAFAAAIMESGLLYLTAKCFPGHADGLFLDFYVRHAIVLGQMPAQKQRELLERYRLEQHRIQRANEERDKDVTAFKQAYLASGLEAMRLHLAGCWEAFLVSRRLELARQRAIEVLERSLEGHDQA
jgi:hypothetical protein